MAERRVAGGGKREAKAKKVVRQVEGHGASTRSRVEGQKNKTEPLAEVFGGRPQRTKQVGSKGLAKLEFADPIMQGLLQRHGPAPFHPHKVRVEPTYRTLVSSIVGQQLSGKAAQTIFARLEAAFALEPKVLFEAKPDDLRAIGLSWGKVSYMQDLSRFALEGGLEGIESLEDQAITERLVQVKGIGVWSVQMFLMFGLGRPDVWPVLDLGIRKGAEKLYGVSDKKELETLGEQFRPFRSHAAWLLWRSLE